MATLKQKYPCPSPYKPIVEMVAAALGEPVELTYRRGRNVRDFIFQLFELNAHENRYSTHVLTARIDAPGQLLDTVCEDETRSYLEKNPGRVPKLLAALDRTQGKLDRVRGICETALEKANIKASELAGAEALEEALT